MRKIVECVPNFSVGRDPDTIDAIAGAIKGVDGCRLLDVDPGYSTNRTVYTFVGDPESVIEGALAGARVARKMIDMRGHKGEHPRFGAMDVCPFIPVVGVTMDECVEISRRFAQKAADELAVPFYLYEQAAPAVYRCKLSDIRQGEYEGLAGKLEDPRWKPDFGPDTFVPEWGATATGARMFLIAYNVNLLATSNQAHRIALNLRETGRGEGSPGKLQNVQGMGWFVDEYDMAQVTVNLTDYKITPLHVVYEEVKKEAELLGLPVAGSEIVGLVPLESLLSAADYYIEKEGLFIYRENQKLRLAIERLGLNSIVPFRPEERIIEYITAEKPEEPLASMTTRAFIEEVASRSSAPGGGSVSAVCAAMGVGLGAMVAKLTYGVRKFENVQGHIQKVLPTLDSVTQQLIAMIDADTSAFNEFMDGLRMPQNTKEERRLRKEKMQNGLKTAIDVPLTTMRLGDLAWGPFEVIARYGNPASRSDTQVGAASLKSGIWGAYQNVLINMVDIEDGEYRQKTLEEAEKINQRAADKCDKVLSLLENRG
ncbi:glutamate formimidoyltransferase [Desulforhopalus singaporensis]|uniref:Formimidoyltransferase-cyclodeaminase n=1 Tax=Desulforhopalus singaporensis TaxID=91360 RepID=A0A1H0RPD6_9BACT|nr:glutamate formimidoyltransferase [Desulforhopalus singaporensis]SDP30816.1 glutamate formiminotransferase / formiminotetrahydrofolate cyclodeaminase [Desulforhopalus singaporensis]